MSDPHTLVGGWTLADRYRDLLLKRIRLREKRGVIRLPPGLEYLRSKDKQENLLARKRWIVNVQTPPDRCVGPDAALGYLAGYVRGGAIGNGRMVADDGERVTYWIKEYCEDGARKDETILGEEFVGRFTWNILPFRFWRVRSRGFLAACNKKKSLEAIRAQIGESSPPVAAEKSETTSGDEDDAYELKSPRCKKCGAEQMTWLDEILPRVAWIVRRYSHFALQARAAGFGPVRRARPP